MIRYEKDPSSQRVIINKLEIARRKLTLFHPTNFCSFKATQRRDFKLFRSAVLSVHSCPIFRTLCWLLVSCRWFDCAEARRKEEGKRTV